MLLHLKYPKCTWHVTISAHINDMVVTTWKYTICSLCMLRLVPDDYICTIAYYGTVVIIFLIVMVNMEYIILLCHSWLGFSDFDRFSWLLVLVSALWFVQFAVLGNCLLDLNWDLHLPLGTHTSVDMVKTMFFYNCQTRKQLIIIALYHQSSIVFINIKLIIKYTNDT